MDLKKKKLSGKYSAFTIAGSAIGVTANKFKKWHKSFWDNIHISIKLHKIKKLIVINKSDKLTTPNEEYLNISCLNEHGIEILVSKIQDVFQDDLPIIYSEFHKIVLEQDDYFIEKIENQFICSGELVTNMINISGNKDSVLDEIFIRFEKSVLSREINEMGAIDGDTIVLGNLEFEYKQ